MKNNSIFVIIITYNGAKWIERCLKSVYESTISTTPVIIDNGSTDDTLKIVRNKFPQCSIIETGENLGFGRANNLGIAKAIKLGYEYVYLLNQDAWVEPDVFGKLITLHRINPKFGILSPIQMTGNGKRLDPGFERNAVCRERCENFLDDWKKHNMKELYETLFVMAAHWMIHTPDLKELGLFSPAFPHYGEDSNMIHRYRYHNYKIGICGHAMAYHDREYRIQTPEKKLYMNYIVYLTLMNNPLISSLKQRLKGTIYFICKCILNSWNTSFKLRIKTIINGLKGGYSGLKYLNIYKQKGFHFYE